MTSEVGKIGMISKSSLSIVSLEGSTVNELLLVMTKV